MLQLSLKIDNRDFREQLPDEIVLRQQGRHLLGGSPDATDNSWITETVLQNIRVLAIDQVIEEKDGEKSKLGNTATLELTAQQVEIITAAQKIAGNKLNLALRSVEDSEIEPSDSGGSHLLSSGPRRKRGSVKIIRYGTTSEVRPRS